MKNSFYPYLVLVLMGLMNSIINPTVSQAQSDQNTWKKLSKITFKKEYDEFLGFKVDVPVFSDSVKELDGSDVVVEGYIIPIEGYKSQKEFVFSAFPYNMCYFCGGAGPETVMEVEAAVPIEYTVEKIVIKGKLSLNEGDINSFMYQLSDATMVE